VPKCVSLAQTRQHSLDTQRQSLQKPLDGPLEVPVMHENESLQYPHALIPVQVEQLPALAHGSAEAQLVQCQSPQNPLDGPLDVPVEHVPVSLQ